MLEYRMVETSAPEVVVGLDGELDDQRWTRVLQSVLRPSLEDGSVQTIVTEISNLRSITLEGIATLLMLWRDTQNAGKGFRVRGASGPVRRKLEETGLARRLCEEEAS